MYDASIAPPLRPAMSRIEVPERMPVDGSSAICSIPDQNEPKFSHQLPASSTIRFGSIALKLLDVADSTTRPLLVQLPEAPVGLVARKIAEWFEPNVEAE